MGSDEVLHALEQVAAQIADLEAQAAELKVERNRLALEAMRARVPREAIKAAAQLSRPMLYKIEQQIKDSG